MIPPKAVNLSIFKCKNVMLWNIERYWSKRGVVYVHELKALLIFSSRVIGRKIREPLVWIKFFFSVLLKTNVQLEV